MNSDGDRLSPAIMGILNCTPDSFSDGGVWQGEAAVDHALAMAEQGAAWIDVGGESTRPGAAAVPPAEQLRRVLPVVRRLADQLDASRCAISIDTASAEVATAALDAGAAMVNDISAGADEQMAAVVRARHARWCLMHMQGRPATMQDDPRYHDVVVEVISCLSARRDAAERAGVPREALLVDPGIGFGKATAHNMALLRALPRIASQTACPVLVGLSRKRFIADLLGRALPPGERDHPSHVLHALIAEGCSVLRVHDVAGAVEACRLASALASKDSA